MPSHAARRTDPSTLVALAEGGREGTPARPAARVDVGEGLALLTVLLVDVTVQTGGVMKVLMVGVAVEFIGSAGVFLDCLLRRRHRY
jgi:hypothetical protein